MPVEETRGAPAAPTATMPVPDAVEDRLAAAGLAGLRDDVVSCQSRIAPARERLAEIEGVEARGREVISGAQSAVRRARRQVVAFEREQALAQRALAGLDALGGDARARLNGALRGAAGAPADGDLVDADRDRLMRLASEDMAAAWMRERFEQIAPDRSLSPAQAAARVDRARKRLDGEQAKLDGVRIGSAFDEALAFLSRFEGRRVTTAFGIEQVVGVWGMGAEDAAVFDELAEAAEMAAREFAAASEEAASAVHAACRTVGDALAGSKRNTEGGN